MSALHNKRYWLIGIVVVLFIGFSIIANCGKRDPDVIKIGAILPLSGDYSALGESCKRGIDIAVENNNSSNNYRHTIVKYEDSKGFANEAINATRKLIDNDRVCAIIGEISSNATLAIAPITTQNGVILISPTASSPKISDLGSYVFRVCASDIAEGNTMAIVAYKYLSISRTAILFINNEYGIGLKDAFEEEFVNLGGKITSSQAFGEKEYDFKTLLLRIHDSNPQAIYMPGYAGEMAIILKQARELGLHVKFLSSIDFENPKIKELAGDAAEGVLFTAYKYDINSNNPQIKIFVDEFMAKYKIEPDIYAALSYDAANVLIYAINAAGTKSERIRDILGQLNNFPGVTNNITFDSKGDVKHAIAIKMYKEGKFNFVCEDSLSSIN